MKLDLYSTNNWYLLGEKLTSSIKGATESHSLRAYRGLYSALFEVTATLSEAFPHKRSIGVLKGGSSLFDPILASFSRQSYNIHQIDQSALQTAEDFGNWVSQCNKDLLFVLSVEDHPMSGEIFSNLNKDLVLSEKKIFSLSLSHSGWLQGLTDIQSFAARICAINSDYAFVQFGSRVKPAQLISSQQFWKLDEVLRDLAIVQNQFGERKESVVNFEAQIQPPWQPLLTNENRIFDRSVIYSTEIHGEYFLQQMRELGLPDSEIETTNLCRWQGIIEYSKWWGNSPSSDQLRGLVVISSAALERPDFKENFKKATERCLKSSERK